MIPPAALIGATFGAQTLLGLWGAEDLTGATAAHIVGTSRAAGIDLELPRAEKSHYDRAIAPGGGQDGWTGLIEFIKKPATT